MLDMEVHVHLILGGALALFLGIVVLIAALDNPFRGQVSVGPDAFQLRPDQRCRTRGRARELCRFPSWCWDFNPKPE
jgi:hypothetical protein